MKKDVLIGLSQRHLTWLAITKKKSRDSPLSLSDEAADYAAHCYSLI